MKIIECSIRESQSCAITADKEYLTFGNNTPHSKTFVTRSAKRGLIDFPNMINS